MRIVITGGGGFLGHQLCEALLQVGTLVDSSGLDRAIERIVLVDALFARGGPKAPADQTHSKIIPVDQIVGSVDDADLIDAAIGKEQACSIFHLASMVSGECEERFDDALRVNLKGGWEIFEAARRIGRTCKVVFASSIACFGGESMHDPCGDTTKLTPQTTYGMTKAICELMVNDYSRKGFFDGRSARLPTVIIRPGKPNAAASGWASGMFREPLQGIDCPLPVHLDQRHPMTSYRTVIDSLIAVHNIPASSLGRDRAIGLPARSVTPRQARNALREVAEHPPSKLANRMLGEIIERPDPRIQGIVDQWPVAIDGSRGIALGLPEPPNLNAIIRDFVEDFIDPRS